MVKKRVLNEANSVEVNLCESIDISSSGVWIPLNREHVAFFAGYITTKGSGRYYVIKSRDQRLTSTQREKVKEIWPGGFCD